MNPLLSVSSRSRLLLKGALFIAIGTCTFACRDKKDQSRRGRTVSSTQVKVPGTNGDASVSNLTPIPAMKNQFTLSYGTPTADAYDSTFASLPIQFSDAAIPANAPLESRRFLYLKTDTLVSAEQKALLMKACQNVILSAEAASVVELKNVPDSKQAHLIWRSYYGVDAKRLMNGILAEKGMVRCLLKITADQKISYVVFDPIPNKTSKLLGTQKSAEAIDEVLMLLEEDAIARAQVLDQRGYFSEITEAPVYNPSSKPLRRKSERLYEITPQDSRCRIVTEANGETKFLNNTELKERGVKSSIDYSYIPIRRVALLPIGGRYVKACEKIKVEFTADVVSAKISCQDFYEVQKELGYAGGCNWAVDYFNDSDPENSQSMPMSMGTTNFQSLDLNPAAAAAYQVPEQADNPVRSKTIEMIGFSSHQLRTMARAYDLWMYTARPQYKEISENYIKNITHHGESDLPDPQGDCLPGGSTHAYAGFNTTRWAVCNFLLSPNEIDDYELPTRLLLIARVAMHETLHAVGRLHDYDDKSYAPCSGSAYSAIIMYNLVTQCKEAWCTALKDAAIISFIQEIGYSLQLDKRRSEGLCQTWVTGLGINPATIPNPPLQP